MVKFTENNMKTLEKRYLLKDETGKTIETPDQLFDRVVDTVCGVEGENLELRKNILEMMHDLRFLPNTPTLMNAGTTNMLSACFVINIDDTLESIVHNAGWQQAYIHKQGGGVGMNFSKLRPKGDLIKSTGGVTTGVMGFLPIFNELSESIRQGGKRDGANMGILSISHPEIESWITAKVDNNKFKNFNLSVLITDEFMKAVESDSNWNLEFNGKIYKTVKAQYLFDLICESAHKCGCPGILFVDEMNRNNLLKDIMWIDCTNPCGEIGAFVGYYNNELVAESCNLGSLNLSKYCISDLKHDGYYLFNTERYIEDIHNATEFLDLVIDANHYPFDFIDKGTKLTRKIGLGTTGLSECLIKLRMEYGSSQSIELIKEIFKILKDESHKKSEEFGITKGIFPLYDELEDELENLPARRNLFTTAIAPTGTIGRFMLGHPYSSGIEPPPAICMSSNIIDSKIEDGIHPLLIEMLKNRLLINPELDINIINIIKQIKENGKSIQHLTQIPQDIRNLFKIAEEISIEEHIKVQSTIQKYIDNAVSKTINMSNSATIDDVKKAYTLAYKSKCKGVTIYRDNCKDHQVFESSKLNIESISVKRLDDLEPIEDLSPRPDILGALSFTKKTACNTLFINPTYLGSMDKSALESFIGANGGCTAMRNGLAICISVYQRLLETIDPITARKGLDIVMTHLQNIPCQVCTKKIEDEKHRTDVKHPVDSISCPAAVADVMKFMLGHKVETYIDGKLLTNEIKITKQLEKLIPSTKKKCPDCGNTLLFKQEGCMNDLCPNCGWGGCS